MLTPKELQVLNLVSKGLSTSAISLKLAISNNTVDGYRKDLLRKFKAKNSAELVRKAIKAQWLTVSLVLLLIFGSYVKSNPYTDGYTETKCTNMAHGMGCAFFDS